MQDITAEEVIKKVLDSKSVIDVFYDVNDWKFNYKNYIRLIHPDVCKLPKAKEATEKLNQFKDELDSGKKHNDDAGTVSYALKTVEIVGDKDLIKKSLDNYNYLMSLTDESSKHFKKYLPISGKLISENELEFTLSNRAVPLSSLGTVEQKHANWMLSRMFEFAGWINQLGYSHAGINPESVYIMPENHGMTCISFYHMTKLNTSLKAISAKYSNFYPPQVFTNKKAESNIDIELSKRTAIYLLGDKSGSGVILRKTHENEIIDFLQKQQYDTIETYKEYRTLLKKYFDTKQFHVFNA
ncbi:MAG TPA: hypothetical protein VN026_04520 [Bacteroidia bacterium]|jgi:hypothetical protein|nr:hypothetical protein [Bacteroidia bacterium]